MPLTHFTLALLVMAVWGSNFVVIKAALQHLPPLLLAALRFTFAFFPLAFFLKKPAVSLGNLASYGLLIGVGQFGLLFIAMRHDITPGLASLVVQVQVFFTIGFSMRLTGEHVHRFPAMASGVRNADAMTWAAVLWQSVGNTMFGYAAWGWLLSRHPAATVTPMALLVPVFGIGASALLLGEALPAWKLLAAVLVMSGLVVGLLWPRVAAMRGFQ
ncbi:MAG: EamA family transporter [Sphingomonadales bacterium]|nr:EamA family transporter [Sphingomonadales bacterium]